MKHILSRNSGLVILSCGGTILGLRDPVTGEVDASLSIASLIEHFDELASLVDIPVRQVLDLISEHMVPAHWIDIAIQVDRAIHDGFQAIVITHGTFTLPYTAAALSFMLRNLPVPVVITGAEIAPLEDSSDAPGNLLASLYAAQALKGRPGVYVVAASSDISAREYFSDGFGIRQERLASDRFPRIIVPGACVRKAHTWRVDCFQSVNTEPLGEVLVDGTVRLIDGNWALEGQISEASEYVCEAVADERVAVVTAYPGLDPNLLIRLREWGYQGIIITGYADGALCAIGEHTLVDAIKSIVGDGCPVFLTSQPIGVATLTEYAGSRSIREAGGIPLKGMTMEAATAKLMWAFGHPWDQGQVIDTMLRNLAGELT